MGPVVDEIPDDAVFVNCSYDQRVTGTHPRTGELVTPPINAVFLCRPGSVPEVKATLQWLMDKYSWSGEISEEPLAG